jgi:murein DD-endopeptidase MepM/ murein hydrolase activator NlpD
MQLFWVSGSTGAIKQVNISKKRLVRLLLILCSAFLLMGVLVFSTGIHIALEINPKFAREVSGIVTMQERMDLDAKYLNNLKSTQSQLEQAVARFNELQAIKDRYLAISTPYSVKQKVTQANFAGGPLTALSFAIESTKTLAENLEELLLKTSDITEIFSSIEPQWEKQYTWLRSLPIGPPINARLGMTSNFGARLDPFSKSLTQHYGIDFVSPVGTPVIASGDGTVLRSGFDAAYGNFIEISHSEGFISKYAHNSKLFIKSGDSVLRGQLIALSGSTGRSTGPHLHYEIHQNQAILNPAKILVYAPPSNYW